MFVNLNAYVEMHMLCAHDMHIPPPHITEIKARAKVTGLVPMDVTQLPFYHANCGCLAPHWLSLAAQFLHKKIILLHPLFFFPLLIT